MNAFPVFHPNKKLTICYFKNKLQKYFSKYFSKRSEILLRIEIAFTP